MIRTPYDVIGVSSTASADVIRAEYRRRAALLHPDRNPGFREEATARLAELNAAYAILSDPETRARYDRDPASFNQPAAPASPTQAQDLDDAEQIAAAAVDTFVSPTRAAPAARLVSLLFGALRARAGRPPPTGDRF